MLTTIRRGKRSTRLEACSAGVTMPTCASAELPSAITKPRIHFHSCLSFDDFTTVSSVWLSHAKQRSRPQAKGKTLKTKELITQERGCLCLTRGVVPAEARTRSPNALPGRPGEARLVSAGMIEGATG